MRIGFSLDRDQLKAISSIVADVGQVFLASVVIPFFTADITPVLLQNIFVIASRNEAISFS